METTPHHSPEILKESGAKDTKKNVIIPDNFNLNELGERHPQPQSIEKPLPNVEKIDYDFLPEGLKDWIKDISYRTQTPPDFAFATVVTLTSGLIGARISIRPKQYDDWTVIPNLWGMLIGSPSMLKSPIINEVSKPIKFLEQNANEAYKAECKRVENATEIHKVKKENLKAKLKRGQSDLSELEALLNEEQPMPIQKRYLANDATIEKLGIILNDNPTGITIIRDELAGLLASWERSGHEQDRAFYLEAWNGMGSFQVDRVGRPSLSIPNLCLSIFGGIQPSKLAGYFQNLINSYGNDGMIQRFQIAVYPDRLNNWNYVDSYPEEVARKKAYRIFEQLANFDPNDLVSKDEYVRIPYIKFTYEAQPLFKNWLEQLEEKLRSEELPNLIEEHLGKYRSLVPSLALIFHLIDYASLTADDSSNIELCKQGVSLKALQKAIKYASYLESHAYRIYAEIGNSGQQAVYQLSKKIAEGILPTTFTVREIQRKGWYLLTDNATINDAVKTLVALDWLTEIKSEPTGGRPPAPQYIVNPRTKDFYKKA
ncbi:YfjI family protein [Runella zeae]|uniref:YfjI family protein n=1 Tax=Runella zeae TaxID=94255 RepID=UPI000418CED1|nr:YfjI family protein [Runella zeae]